MWRKEDANPQPSSTSSSTAANPVSTNTTNAAPYNAVPLSGKAAACISQGIRIKGEVTGSEDLFVDGQVEGKITLTSSALTVGPNATVKAEVQAKEVVLRGRVIGRVHATEKIQIWNTARVDGDLKAERIAVEEGAELHGSMEVGKAEASADTKSVKKAEAKSKDAGEQKASSGAAVAGAS